jgi:hypothetical protein
LKATEQPIDIGASAGKCFVVYTDADDINPVTGLGELYSGDNRFLNLVIEIGIASAIRDPTGVIKIKFAATHTGMEWACEVISAQVISALVGNPQSPWGNIFKRLVQKVRRLPTRRGGMAQQGVRFAARRITLVCMPMWDIVPGKVLQPGHAVLDFVALTKAKLAANHLLDQSANLPVDHVFDRIKPIVEKVRVALDCRM